MDLELKLNLIQELPKTGYFSPLAIEILLEIAINFDISFNDFVEVLKGAHVVIRNDDTDTWFKWNKMGQDEGACVNTAEKTLYNLDKGSCKALSQIREHKGKTHWKSYHSIRSSSHPSVPVYNEFNRKVGKVFENQVASSVDQYEINLGYNLKDSLFCLLVGSYEFRGKDNIPTKDHSGIMGDPKKFNYTTQPEKKDRKYKVTWFQFEQYSATEGGIVSSVLHIGDWLKYTVKKKNIGPFGESNYTEKPWKPLYIIYNPSNSENEYLFERFGRLGEVTIKNIATEFCKNICFNNTSHYGIYDKIMTKPGCAPFKFSFDRRNNFIVEHLRPKSKKTHKVRDISFRQRGPRGKTISSKTVASASQKPSTVLSTSRQRKAISRMTALHGKKNKKKRSIKKGSKKKRRLKRNSRK